MNIQTEHSENIKKYKIIYLLISLLFVIYIVMQGVVIAPDSNSYIHKSLIRQPMYPLVIGLFGFFDQSYYLLMVFQALLGTFAIYRVTNILQKIFNLNLFFTIMLMLVFFTPYLGKTANYILSEGVSYPIFLLAYSFIINGLIAKKYQDILFFLLFSGILTLLRSQFVFLYVVAAILVIFVCCTWQVKQKSDLRLKFVIVFSFISIVIFTYLFERGYNYVYHNKFVKAPFFWVHAAVAPLYVSSLNQCVSITADIQTVTPTATQTTHNSNSMPPNMEPQIKARDVKSESVEGLCVAIKQQMQADKLSAAYAAGFVDMPYHFYTSFDRIIYAVVLPILSKYNITEHDKIDSIMKDITLTLAKVNKESLSMLYARNYSAFLGGYYSAVFLFSVFFIMLFCYFKYQDNIILCLLFTMILHFGNTFVVALVQGMHIRYSFYTDIVTYVLLVLIFYNFLCRRDRYAKC